MILRAAAVLVLLGLYHLAGVHGFIAYILDDSRVYMFDRLVQSAVAVALFRLALPPSRSRYVHREELRGIWEAIEEFDRDLRAVRRDGGSYARAFHAGIGRVRSAVYRLAWILRGSPTPETMDSREACRRMWRPEDERVQEVVDHERRLWERSGPRPFTLPDDSEEITRSQARGDFDPKEGGRS